MKFALRGGHWVPGDQRSQYAKALGGKFWTFVKE